MHEMSIAVSIIDIVSNNLPKNKTGQLSEIEIEIGKLAGIEIDALAFALETAIASAGYKNAKAKLKIIDAVANCPNCKKSFEIESLYSKCPACEKHNLKIISGQELSVKSITIN